MSCMSCLYILKIDPLSVVSFAVIFSHSESSVFTCIIFEWMTRAFQPQEVWGPFSCFGALWVSKCCMVLIFSLSAVCQPDIYSVGRERSFGLIRSGCDSHLLIASHFLNTWSLSTPPSLQPLPFSLWSPESFPCSWNSLPRPWEVRPGWLSTDSPTGESWPQGPHSLKLKPSSLWALCFLSVWPWATDHPPLPSPSPDSSQGPREALRSLWAPAIKVTLMSTHFPGWGPTSRPSVRKVLVFWD